MGATAAADAEGSSASDPFRRSRPSSRTSFETGMSISPNAQGSVEYPPPRRPDRLSLSARERSYKLCCRLHRACGAGANESLSWLVAAFRVSLLTALMRSHDRVVGATLPASLERDGRPDRCPRAAEARAECHAGAQWLPRSRRRHRRAGCGGVSPHSRGVTLPRGAFWRRSDMALRLLPKATARATARGSAREIDCAREREGGGSGRGVVIAMARR